LLEVYSETAIDPIVSFGTDKAVNISAQLARNSAGNLKAFAVAAKDLFLVGTLSGDVGFVVTPGKTMHFGANSKGSLLQITGSGVSVISPLAMTGQKITGLANGSEATDAVAFGQLGSAAFVATGTFQPIDGDLTAIAALTTETFGRELLTMASAAATR